MSTKVAVDKCSDPYGIGCRNEATGSMRGQQFTGEFGNFTPVEITIHTCDSCGNWNTDWDWDTEPEGPYLARDKRNRG